MKRDFSTHLTQLTLVITAIACGWLVSRWWLYPALNIPDNAPLILRPILGFIVAWCLLAYSGSSWREFGFKPPAKNSRALTLTLLYTALLYAAVWITLTYIAPLLAQWFNARGTASFIAYIRGHPSALVGWIAVAWIVGALIEELLFRGFLLNTVANLIPHRAFGAIVGVVFQAVLFGLLHWYQGALGLVMATTFALVYGAAYLLFGRNLIPLILVHGIWNTQGIVNVYFSP